MNKDSDSFEKIFQGIAHDINNLFSSIIASTDILKLRLEDREDVTYLIQNIENCSRRATELTKGLLSYGHPTSKRKTVIKTLPLLDEIVISVNQMFSKGIKFEKIFEKNLPDILGNSTEIFQVLFNLCKNAYEAISGYGTITISACKKSIYVDDNSSGETLLPGDYLSISVSDSGKGISEENLSKIFEPYYSTKNSEIVSGLGLFNVFGIIKGHKGKVQVTSKLGEGATFEIFIPVADRKKRVIEETKLILLADDEFMLRELLAELLESYNYTVIQVVDGNEVMRLMTEKQMPDLLIIDYHMPLMDGIECIKKIRKLEIQIPIILSTGQTNITREIEYLQIDAILQKPFEFAEMLEAINRIMNKT